MNSLAVQWSGLHAVAVKGQDSVPGWGTKILQATQSSQKKKEGEEEKVAYKILITTLMNLQGITNPVFSFHQ